MSVTSEVDRGSSGCTYNNGEDAFSAKKFVSVGTLEATDFDRMLTKLAGQADVTDVPGLGIDAKFLAIHGQQMTLLLVKVDGLRTINVQVAPNGNQANSTQVAKLIIARMQNG